MKTYFTLHSILVVFLLSSCNFTNEPKFLHDSGAGSGDFTVNDSFPNEKAEIENSNDKLTAFHISDNTGTHLYTIWYPSSWKQITNSKQFTFEGPNNIKISGEFGQHFMFGSSGYNQRQPMNINAIIEEFFMPTARQYQRKLLNVYEVPKVAQTEHQYRTQLWSYAHTEKNTRTYAIEWEDPNQIKYITLLHVIIDHSQLGSNWGFYGRYLQAEAAHFDSAKNAFIKGMESKQYNQQAIIAYNNNEMQKANIRDQGHQARMAAINARGNAASNTGNIYSDILDISHSGYLSRSNITSHGHSKTISGIQETVTIANHNSGEHYSVPMGSEKYWVSNDGSYFGTDNTLYNPNTDVNMYNREWTEFEVEN